MSLVPVLVVMLTAGFSAVQTRNTGSRTVWDGVYGTAQATRGKTHYENSCGSCHGADLSGGRGRPLKGDVFMRDWSGDHLGSLFSRMKNTMPLGAPASLSEDAYIEIVAYALQMNAFPPGTEDLTTGVLEGIRIEGKDGPEAVPNFALVRVIGCLLQGPDNAWVLDNASEPVRTKDPVASKDDELKDSEAKGLGSQTFQLMNVYPRPDSYKGHKVEAKGFLIKAANDDRINVTSLQTLASSCGR